MTRVIEHVHIHPILKGSVIGLVSLVLVGCQPEGTGSVKGPTDRPSDASLGRPLGNEPDIKLKKNPKAGSETEESKKANELNPRL